MDKDRKEPVKPLGNPRFQRFVEEYCIDFNAARAARDAGYSAKTAKQQASMLMKKPEIEAAVKAHLDMLAKKAEMSASQVIAHLSQIAVGEINVAKLVQSTKGWDNLTTKEQMMIKRIKVQTGKVESREIELWDRLKALELMARVHGILNPEDDGAKREPLSIEINMNGKGKEGPSEKS